MERIVRDEDALEGIPQILVDDLDALWVLLGAFLVFFMQVCAGMGCYSGGRSGIGLIFGSC